jgi:RNase P subunit RPR2
MTARPNYRGKPWQRFRITILKRDLWTCQMCSVLLTSGRSYRRAAVVDHLMPARLRPDLFLSDDNTRAVCKSCHDGPCKSIEVRLGEDADAIRAAKLAWHAGGYDTAGYPLDPSHPWAAQRAAERR